MRLFSLTMILAAAVLCGCATGRTYVKPPALKPGDTIAFVAPAKWRDAEAVEFTRQQLEARGYRVKIDESVSDKYGYLSATDEERARLFMRAYEDPEVDAVFPVTGGFGTTRMIDLLDYDTIRKNPKVLIGYSDITGLHLAIQKKARVMTFHSPFATYMYRTEEDGIDRTFMFDHMWGAIEASAYADRTEPGWTISTDDLTTPSKTMVPGVARGRLTGGNLSLIHAVHGTPFEMETKGMIVFFEDVGEDPYRLDRFFSQLELSGKLDDPAAVILGRFSRCETDDPENSFTLAQVFEHYFADRPYPVVMDFPVGHVIDNASYPMGAMAELDANAGTLRILENAVRVDE